MKLIILGIVFLSVVAATEAAEASALFFENHSPDFLSARWVDPRTQETVVIKGDIKPLQKFSLNSYVGHHFQIMQEPNPATGLCNTGTKECDKVGYFEVTKFPKQGKEPNTVERLGIGNYHSNLILFVAL